jgi:hypothetical protein
MVTDKTAELSELIKDKAAQVRSQATARAGDARGQLAAKAQDVRGQLADNTPEPVREYLSNAAAGARQRGLPAVAALVAIGLVLLVVWRLRKR